MAAYTGYGGSDKISTSNWPVGLAESVRSRFSETLSLKIRLPIEEDTQCQPLAYIPPIPMATSASSPTCLYMLIHALTSTSMHVYPHTCTHMHTIHPHKNKNENKEVCWAVSLYLSCYHAIYKPPGTKAMPAA